MKKILKFYCSYNHDISFEKLFELIEYEFPSHKLDKTITKEGELVPILNRVSFLENSLTKKMIPLFTSGEILNSLKLSGYLLNQNRPDEFKLWYLIIEIGQGLVPNSSFDGLTANLSSILKPDWSTLNLLETEQLTALQFQAVGYEKVTQLGLPRLRSFLFKNMLQVPSNVGWINFWSITSAHLIGWEKLSFEDLVFRSYCTNEGWIIQLTDEPLNFKFKKHLEVLKAVYKRFPAIGGRDL